MARAKERQAEREAKRLQKQLQRSWQKKLKCLTLSAAYRRQLPEGEPWRSDHFHCK